MRAAAEAKTATSARLAMPVPAKAALTARLVTPRWGFLRSMTMTMVIRIRKITVGAQAITMFPVAPRLRRLFSWRK